jgi:hypothetical protein
MSSMIEDKGAEYAAQWPATIARQTGLAAPWVAVALQRAGHLTEEQVRDAEHAMEHGQLVPQVGEMAPASARAVVEHLRDIERELRESQMADCQCCGTPLRGGECPAC